MSTLIAARPSLALPEPACPLGYPTSQIQSILGDGKTKLFVLFMEQSKLSIQCCTGVGYSLIYKQPYPSTCYYHPHGDVYFSIDLHRFNLAKPPVEISYEVEGRTVKELRFLKY